MYKSIIWNLIFTLLSVAPTTQASHVTRKSQPKMEHEGIYYFLSTLFGPDSKEILRKGILLHPNLWGGPCDPYAQVFLDKAGRPALRDSDTECPDDGLSSKVDFYPDRDVLAVALLDKTCEALVKEKKLEIFS